MSAIKPVSYQVLVKVFEQDGFTFDRQKGDHLIYTKRVCHPKTVTVSPGNMVSVLFQPIRFSTTGG